MSQSTTWYMPHCKYCTATHEDPEEILHFECQRIREEPTCSCHTYAWWNQPFLQTLAYLSMWLPLRSLPFHCKIVETMVVRGPLYYTTEALDKQTDFKARCTCTTEALGKQTDFKARLLQPHDQRLRLNLRELVDHEFFDVFFLRDKRTDDSCWISPTSMNRKGRLRLTAIEIRDSASWSVSTSSHMR